MIVSRMVALAVSAFALVLAPHVPAQSYPVKPIRFIVPFPPGGGTDFVARLIANELTPSLGQQVIIDNRSGAQGSVGAAAAARAPADGYTIVFVASNVLAMNPWIYKDVGYDSVRDFSHITLVTLQPQLAVVNPGVPAKNLKELAALARAKPDNLTFASSSSASQLAAELFKLLSHTKMVHVAYKGASAAMLDVVAGRVDFMFSSPASSIGMIKAGKLRAIAVTGPKRLPAFPDVLTAKESGFPDFEVSGWYGVSAPANTPKEVVTKLNMEIRRALNAPAIKDRLLTEGLEPRTTSSEEMTSFVKTEYERWGPVVKAAGLKPE